MNKAIEELRNNPKAVLTKNIAVSVEEMEYLANKWKVEKKPSKIVGTFTFVSDLTEENIKHFDTAPYMFRPMPGTLYGGMLLDDSMDYVHIVLMSEEVLEFILSIKSEKDLVEDGDINLAECEQCGEPAWDGYICHSCGMKII